MNALQKRETPIIENLVQGDLWRNKILPLFRDKTVLPLILYYDDYQTEDFGVHTSDGKLGGIYYVVPSLPPAFQSALENIFTAFIFYTNDKTNTTNRDLYPDLLEELRFLEDTGIEVVNDVGERIYFALTLIVGDNLAIHSLLGFVESFSSKYTCRFCRVYRGDMNFQTAEMKHLLRDRENYFDDVTAGDVSTTGIKEKCIWNSLKSFHCVENCAIDLMHEIELGAGNCLMTGFIELLIARYRIALDALNNRIQSFHYGDYEKSNKPSEISMNHVKSRKLPLAAAECLFLIRHFGLMVADIIDIGEDEDVWVLYKTFNEIISIITAPKLNMQLLPYLDNLIGNLIKLHIRCVPDLALTVKLHPFVHTIRLISSIGPLSRPTCYRFEAKHKDYRENARVSYNRKNLPSTMTKRNQLKFCFRLLENRGLIPQLEMSKVNSIRVLPHYKEFSHILSPEMKNSQSVKWVTISRTRYSEGTVVVIDIDDEYPVFGEVLSFSYLKRKLFIF